ncbi:hypothetical protein ACFQOZ_19200 [Comamonas endophytica]|uniref:hypothetical protein n=1 Tax=Comamonas endophytica TaxID=2949090 RepID=UPI0036111418
MKAERMSQSFEAADLLLHRHVTDISCSWDEGLAACCVESVNEAKDSTTSAIWIYPANGDAPGR